MNPILDYALSAIITLAFVYWIVQGYLRDRLTTKVNTERTALVRYLYNRDHDDERHRRYASNFGRVTFERHMAVLKAGGDPLDLYGLLGADYRIATNGR